MKGYILFWDIICLCSVVLIPMSCSKDDEPQYNLNGTEYPKGIKVIDLLGSSECTLPPCDSRRIDRLSLKNVIAIISNDSTLSIALTFDSIIEFSICGDKLNGFNSADIVLISGIAKDGCGYLNNVFPIEEEYYLIISEIQKI